MAIKVYRDVRRVKVAIIINNTLKNDCVMTTPDFEDESGNLPRELAEKIGRLLANETGLAIEWRQGLGSGRRLPGRRKQEDSEP